MMMFLTIVTIVVWQMTSLSHSLERRLSSSGREFSISQIDAEITARHSAREKKHANTVQRGSLLLILWVIPTIVLSARLHCLRENRLREDESPQPHAC